MGEAEVIQFPEPQRRTPSCLLCIHASIGAVTYCREFREEIDFEMLAAEDCPEYVEDEGA